MRNTRTPDEHLRESYRKRLDEIFAMAPEEEPDAVEEHSSVSVAVAEPEEPVSADAAPPVPEPAQGSTPVAADAVESLDLDGAATRIAHSLTACLSAAVHGLEEKQAADTGKHVQSLRDAVESQSARLSSLTATVAQAFETQTAAQRRLDAHDKSLAVLAAASAQSSEAHSEVLTRLQTQDSQLVALTATATQSAASLDARLRVQDEGMARLEAALVRSADAQTAMQAHLMAQADQLATLMATVTQLAQSYQAAQTRLDAQAEALRQMNARAGNQQSMLDHYREAVERLRDISSLPGLPVQLPENL